MWSDAVRRRQPNCPLTRLSLLWQSHRTYRSTSREVRHYACDAARQASARESLVVRTSFVAHAQCLTPVPMARKLARHSSSSCCYAGDGEGTERRVGQAAQAGGRRARPAGGSGGQLPQWHHGDAAEHELVRAALHPSTRDVLGRGEIVWLMPFFSVATSCHNGSRRLRIYVYKSPACALVIRLLSW